ncbi:unnamed protein product [Penicillium glandicola]
MAPLKIIVVGKSSVTHAPERGTLRFSVKGNGPDQQQVAKEVATSSTNVQNWIKSTFEIWTDDHPEPPLTKFSSTSIRTWTTSTDRDNNPVPNPHHAIQELLSYPKVEIDGVDWSLTDETGSRLASDARQLALRDAIQQANDYSTVLGRAVEVVEIADQGIPYRATHTRMMANNFDYSGEDAPPLDLTPQDIDVESNINVTLHDMRAR